MYQLLLTTTVITALLCAVYVVMAGMFCYGWIRTPYSYKPSSGNVTVTVIVPARNEGAVVLKCLQALALQNYPSGKVSFVVVDDHSTDGTAGIVRAFCDVHPRFSIIRNEGTGKKSAITAAINNSNAELIITTDADCTMESSWLERIVAFYEHSGAGMVVAPLAFTDEKSLFEKMQSVEMMALSGSTAGALYFNKPVLCNGANLAYSRALFLQVKGFEGIDHVATGDDVLLMYKISGLQKSKVKFLMDHEAVVYTKAKSGIKEFIEQRTRWASKGFKTMNAETRLVAVTVWFFCFFLLLLGVLSGFASVKSSVGLPFLQICLILTGIKCVIDFLLLFLAASFFRKKRYLYLFLPEQFIYILYVVVAGFLGNKGKYEWKGRKI